MPEDNYLPQNEWVKTATPTPGFGKPSDSLEWSDDAPSWETPTWATDSVLDNYHDKVPLDAGIAQLAVQQGMISETEYEYARSAYEDPNAKDPDDPRKDLRRTRLERVLGYHDHHGKLMNSIGLMETISGHRFFVASSAAILEGLRDTKGGHEGFWQDSKSLAVRTVGQIGGFGLTVSTEEFSKNWHGRGMYQDVLIKGGADPNSMGTMATGLAFDVLLDPSTWLTFGVGAGTKMTIEGGSEAAKVLARNTARRGSKAAAESVNRGGSFTLTRWGELVMKEAGRKFLKEHVGDIYKRFGVKDIDNIQPEHIGRLLDDADMRGKLAEFAVKNYEDFGTNALDLMRKSGSILNPLNIPKKALGGWTPRSIAQRAHFGRGPASMFQETAGILSKESTIGHWGGGLMAPVIGVAGLGGLGQLVGGNVGAVVGGVLGAGLGVTKSPLLKSGDVLGSALDWLSKVKDVNGRSLEIMSRDKVTPGLLTATRVTGYIGGLAHGGVDRFRRYFTSAAERLPGEERILSQAIVDHTTNEMGMRAFQLRKKFSEKIARPRADGTVVHEKLTTQERQLISHHIEDPNKSPVPEWMEPTVNWVKDQFDDIFELEKEWMIGGEHIENYVTHIYSSSMFNKMMKFLKLETWSPEHLARGPESITSSSNLAFSLHRKIATLDDALIHFGPKNVEVDVARILAARWNVSARMRGKKALTYYLWDKYGLGGMAETLIMEHAGFKKLLRKVKYYRDNVDTGPATPVVKSQLDRLDQLAADIAEHDIKLLGRRSREYMKDGELRYGPAKAGERKVPAPRREGSEVTRVIKGEDGEFVQRTDQFPMPKDEGSPLRTREWFQRHPDHKKLPREELELGRKKEVHSATLNNRKLLRTLAKKGLGIDWDKMTTGEADFLIDFLKTHIRPAELFDVRTGKFLPHGWFGADGMVMVKMQHGQYRRTGSFFDEVEVGPRAAEAEPRSWGLDKGAWGSKVGVSWEALDEVNIADPAERASRATAREARGTTDEITRKLRESERAVRESRTGKRPVAREASEYEKKIAARKSDEGKKAAALEKAIETVNLAGGMREVAEWLSRNVESESLGLVLKRVSKYLDDSKLVSPEVIGGHSGRRGQVAYKRPWDHLEPEAELVTSLQSTQRQLTWPNVAPPRVGGYTAEVVTHELVHVATMKQLDKGQLDFANKVKSPMASAYNDLEELRKLIINKSNWHYWEQFPVLRPGGEAFTYAIKNVHELAAMALTNPKAQEALDGIIIDGESLWSKFVSSMVRLLGWERDPKAKTALTEALRIADEIIDLKKSEAFLETGKKAARKEEARIQKMWGMRTKAERNLARLEQELQLHNDMIRVHGPDSNFGKLNTVQADKVRDLMRHEKGRIDRLKWLDERQPLGAEPRATQFEFQGTRRLRHGTQEPGKETFVSSENVTVRRYDDGGGVFGEDVLYLDAGTGWTNGKMGRWSIEAVKDVEVNFKKAYVVTPDNIEKFAKLVGAKPGATPLQGPEIVEILRKKGYDGLIIDETTEGLSKKLTAKDPEFKGHRSDKIDSLFETLREQFPSRNKDHHGKSSSARGNELRKLETDGKFDPVKARAAAARQVDKGIADDGGTLWRFDDEVGSKHGLGGGVLQPQVIAFNPEKVKIVGDSLIGPTKPDKYGVVGEGVTEGLGVGFKSKFHPQRFGNKRLVPIGDSVYNIDPRFSPKIARDILKRRLKSAKQEFKGLRRAEDGTFEDPVRAQELLEQIDKSTPQGGRGKRYTNRQVQEVVEDTIGPRIKRIKPYRHFESERVVLAKRISDLRKETKRLRASAEEILEQNPSVAGTSKKARRLEQMLSKRHKALDAAHNKVAALRKSHKERAPKLDEKAAKETELLRKAEASVGTSVLARAAAKDLIDETKIELAGAKKAGKPTKKLENKLVSTEKKLAKLKAKEAEKLGPRVDEMTKRVEVANKKAIDFETTTQKAFDGLARAQKILRKDVEGFKKVIQEITPKADIEDAAKLMKTEARNVAKDAKNLSTTLAKMEGRYSRGLIDLDGEYMLPRSMADSIDEVLTSGFDMSKPLHQFLKGYQAFQKLWKIPLTLPFMGYWGRNALTSVGLAANAVGFELLNPHNAKVAFNVVGHLLFRQQEVAFAHLAKSSPKEVRKAWGKSLGEAKKSWTDATITTKDGREISIREMTQEALSRGINQGFVYSEIMHEPFRRLDNVAHGVLIAAPAAMVKNAAMKTAMYGEILTDVPFRVAVFTQEVVNGKSYAEAAESVKKYLNDYSRLSPFEKRWMRTLNPFYSWFQFSLENAFKLGYEKPGQFLMPFKAARNVSEYMTDGPPPEWAPGWINDRLGIWSGPNENGYYTRLQGLAFNQEEAMRQAFAMSDLSNHMLKHASKSFSGVPGVGAAVERVFDPAGVDPTYLDEAPLRFLSQMDFMLKAGAESVRGRDFFSDAPIHGPALALEGSRLEAGRGMNRADDPEGVLENVVTVAGVGGRWLKSYLEYTEKGDGGSKTARVDPWKRWIIGSSPISRLVSTYEKHVKAYEPGEANTLQAAATALGIHVYRYHPNEGKYYRDKKRILGLKMLYDQAGMLDTGTYHWNRSIPDVDNVAQDILGPIDELRKQRDEERK